MHKFASFNHEILYTNDIKIDAISSASLYGKGVFTTVAIYNSKPFLWEKHWQRISNNAQKIGVDLTDFNEEKVYDSLKKVIEKNHISNARCRMTFFDESSSKVWNSSNKNKTSLLIQTADMREIKENILLMVSDFPINSKSPIAGVKSCNYMENIIALEEAKAKGFDEAIRLNEQGKVTSACMANIFWIKDEEIFTPSLKTGCLAGTTRELILDNFQASQCETELDVLKKADMVFLTSSGIGICSAYSDTNTISPAYINIKKMFDLNRYTQ